MLLDVIRCYLLGVRGSELGGLTMLLDVIRCYWGSEFEEVRGVIRVLLECY